MMLAAMLATSDVVTALQKVNSTQMIKIQLLVTHMQVLDKQLVSMCEGVQSDLPYPTKCEEVHSKQNNV